MGEWHNCGRVKFSLAHKWANFWKIAQVTAIFTYGWANFSNMGGRIFGVNLGWAIFSLLKNSERFFHTGVGEFLTHGWAIFQGPFWMGDFSTSQK